ncbi:MAG TPA: DUF1559 domain-containing protein [Capsulimonadaceae bacterium]|jgi:prepilin-type N-terminal cleavage/methylation domain-containing protein/prepilin-type processing-associated H-X9-DG protein
MNAGRKRAFTLIELLVVIAIISILAAILFPVFSQAREKARASACTSNMKQLGLAVLQYNQDYDEQFPLSYTAGGSTLSCSSTADCAGKFTWPAMLMPYIKSSNIFQCPDQPADLGVTQGTWSGGVTSNSFPVGYSYNYSIGGNFTGTDGGSIPSNKSIVVAAAPATVVLITDGGSDPTVAAAINTPQQWPTAKASTYCNYCGSAAKFRTKWLLVGSGSSLANTTDYGGPVARHQGLSNILWVDGHVKALAIEKFYSLYGHEVTNKPAEITTTYWSPCLDVKYGCDYMK